MFELGFMTLVYTYSRHRNNQKNLVFSIFSDIIKIAENSDSLKDTFIASVRRENLIGEEEKKDLLNNLRSNFPNYINLKQVNGENIKQKIQEEIKIDKKISLNIKNSCLYLIHKLDSIEREKVAYYCFTYANVPHFKIHEIDYNFYSKSIDYIFPNLFKRHNKTHQLKEIIFKLNKVTSVINYQITKVNETNFIPYLADRDMDKKEAMLRRDYQRVWNGFYYRIYLNLAEVDEIIKEIYKELLSFEFVKGVIGQNKEILRIFSERIYKEISKKP